MYVKATIIISRKFEATPFMAVDFMLIVVINRNNIKRNYRHNVIIKNIKHDINDAHNIVLNHLNIRRVIQCTLQSLKAVLKYLNNAYTYAQTHYFKLVIW